MDMSFGNDPSDYLNFEKFKNIDCKHLRITFTPPEDTPYENGIFFLDVRIPESYQKDYPKVYFATEIFHPNIYTNGKVCCCFLDCFWKPNHTLKTLMDELANLLKNPLEFCCANCEASSLYYSNLDNFKKKVSELTMKHAV